MTCGGGDKNSFHQYNVIGIPSGSRDSSGRALLHLYPIVPTNRVLNYRWVLVIPCEVFGIDFYAMVAVLNQ